MFDKKQKSCKKRIHLVTDDVLHNRKAFYKVEIVFIYPLKMMENLSIINSIKISQKAIMKKVKKDFLSKLMFNMTS